MYWPYSLNGTKVFMRKAILATLMMFLLFTSFPKASYGEEGNCTNVNVATTAELQSALINAQPCQTIMVAPGTYELTTTTTVGVRGAYFYSTVDGTSTEPITIESADPSNPAVLKGGNIADAGYTLYITGDYWEIRNIHVTHGQKGIILDNSNYTVIDGVEVYHVGQEAIHVRDGSSNVIIENSYVNDTGATLDATDMGFAEGIYIGSDRSVWKVNEGTEGSSAEPGYGYDRHVFNTIVRNNITGPLVRAEPLDIKEGASGTLVENNTFYGGGIVGDQYNFADSFIDVKSYNTTIRNNVGYRQNNSKIDRDIHEINRTSTTPWCPAGETSNANLSDTSDGNTYSNNTFYQGDPPPSDTEAPAAPANLSATAVSGAQIDLSWTASTDNVGVSGYKIYRDGAEVGTTSATTYSDTGLSVSTTYSYTVKAYDAAGNASTASNTASATTQSSTDAEAPAAPTNLSAAAVSSSQIDLSWTASTDNVGVSGYKIYRDGAEVGTTSATTYSDTGLSVSTTYSYTVKAYDAAGNVSAASNTASATTNEAQFSSLKVYYQEGDGGNTGDNDIRPYLKIVNEGMTAIPLSELKIRYYYKKEADTTQNFTVDYAVIGKSNVTGIFGSLASPTSTADTYLEVGFTSGAGDLAAGGDTGTTKTRINNSDWSNYDETNDYSYNATYTAFAEYDKITLYHNGVLVWGIEP